MARGQTVTPVLIIEHEKPDVDWYRAQHEDCGWVSRKAHGGPNAEARAVAEQEAHMTDVHPEAGA